MCTRDSSKCGPARYERQIYGFYTVYLKEVKCGDLRYGRNYYDYQEGTLVFLAPGQVIGYEDNGQTYMAFFPTVDDETDEAAAEDFGLVILKSVTENGEELLTTLDSDEELQRVYDLFMEQLMDEDDENS